MPDDVLGNAKAELAGDKTDAGTGAETIRFEDPTTGEVWEGTPAEVAQKLFHGKQEANRVIVQQKEDNQFLRQTIETHGLGDKKTDTSHKAVELPKDEFFGMLATDPEKAFSVMVSRVLGIDDPKELATSVQALRQDAEAQKEFGQVAAFYSSIGRQEALGSEVSGLIVDRVKTDKLSADAAGMELAYHRLVREGKIKDEGHGTERSSGPPPRLSGRGDREPVIDDDKANSMPLDALRKVAFGR